MYVAACLRRSTHRFSRLFELATVPVWQHPGNFPFEFLVERAAQRAVRGLRIDDEHRAIRLENLALRFDLMALDLREHDELQPFARFLDALSQLMRNQGTSLPMLDPALEAPFDAMLAAVYEAGQVRENVIAAQTTTSRSLPMHTQRAGCAPIVAA